MKENRMKDVFEAIAQRNVPDDINIWPQLAAKVERKNFMQTVRTRPGLALALVILALTLLSGVAYAVGKVMGYVPGVGIVDQSIPLRTLKESVIREREGITVGVYQVVANAEYTFVGYAVDGIVLPIGGSATCGAMPSLLLPDGTKLQILSGGSGGFGGPAGEPVRFETTVNYAPIPADVNEVTFLLDCVLPEGTGPQDWELPFTLIAAPEGFATPAMEVDATFVASGPTFDVPPTPTFETNSTPFEYDPSFPDTPTPVPNGSGLYLDRVIELSDSYILVGNFTDAGDLPGPLMATGSAYDYVPRIQDVNGKPLDFKIRDDIKPVVNWGGVQYWAYEIAKPVQGPLTITLDQLDILVTDKTQFTFDAGLRPLVGQKWELSLHVHLRGYDYVIDSVEVIENGYRFNYHSGTDAPEGVFLEMMIAGYFPERQDGNLVNQESLVTYSDRYTYPSPLPVGQLTVEVGLSEMIHLDGPWVLTWTPPNP